ncbi:MAG: Mrp/NBP35 family ATP-binding protein [Clostridia bacterium]|nr:Mrp/NBP35 family ATP-binding protein [Deltaproteobacteria bacterium]
MQSNIKNFVLIASGKGGVGKSTVATNLAMALARSGHAVGLLDADIYGPSLPVMMGRTESPRAGDDKLIVPPMKFGVKLMSIGYLVDPSQAMVWRGPMLAGAATQLVQDVAWGDLDYLIVDLPPGTGDVQLTLAQKFKVTGAVLVTTPQKVALVDVIRAKAMFDKVRIHTLGVVENMSYFLCPDNNKRYDIFGYGGGESAAKEMGAPFLGRVPIEPAVRECGDAGEPVVSAFPASESAKSFTAITSEMVKLVNQLNLERGERETKRRILPIVS